jgi:hypothetical protein
MPLAPPDCEAIVAKALAAMDDARQTAPFSARHPGLTLDDAYRILARLCTLRTVRGERVIGRKIGFTNRTIWAEYGVYAPMWGFVFNGPRSPATAPSGTAPVYSDSVRRAAHRARDRVSPFRRLSGFSK